MLIRDISRTCLKLTIKDGGENDTDGEHDLQQVDGFLWVLRFPPPIKLTATI
jgi:hypothetical protein